MSQSVSRSRSRLPDFARVALGNLWAPALLVIILFVDAKTLPDRGSTVGRFLNAGHERGTIYDPPIVFPGAYGYETEAGLRIFPNWRDAEAAGFDSAAFDWAVEFKPTRHRRHGFWAPTMLTIRRDLNRMRGGVPQEAVAFFAATNGSEITAEFQAALAGRYIERRIIWPGVGHDAFALALTALLVASCWLNAPRLKPLLRSERRRKRGLCPRCAYDLAGLQRCPECGRPSPASAG